MLLANEVADALPMQRFVIGASQIWERGVALSAQGALQLADRSSRRGVTGGAATHRRHAAGCGQCARGRSGGACHGVADRL